jgi:hypothetical protein
VIAVLKTYGFSAGYRFLLFLVLLPTAAYAGSLPRYAVAVTPTPVLNRPDFNLVFAGRNGTYPLLDACGKDRALEFVAIPGTVFRIDQELQENGSTRYKVTTADYPYRSLTGYYIDSRFVRLEEKPVPERLRQLPVKEAIISALLAADGARYVWGGNIRTGIPLLAEFFTHRSGTGDWLAELRGVDCSGLLYEATSGYTPRNTSSLINYGKPVAIAGLSRAQIAAKLLPLDLIVWDGHVLIVLDRQRLIESRLECDGKGGGVRVRGVTEALQQIMKGRAPVDDYHKGGKKFVVRRWYQSN